MLSSSLGLLSFASDEVDNLISSINLRIPVNYTIIASTWSTSVRVVGIECTSSGTKMDVKKSSSTGRNLLD